MALREITETNFSDLLRSIDPSHSLMGELRSVPLLKDHISSIKQQRSIDDKNDLLLTTLCEVPDDLQVTVMDGFIAALRHTAQDHVANIFRRESDSVLMSQEHYELLCQNTDKIYLFLEPKLRLLNILVRDKVFTLAHRDLALSQQTTNDMAQQTINILLRRPESDFDKFINALNETGQDHVACIITGQGNSQPVSEKFCRKLACVVPQMEPKTSGLITTLYSMGVFSEYDRQRALGSDETTDIERSEMIMDLMSRKSQSAFDSFILALCETNQKHIATELIGEELVATILMTTSPSCQRDQLQTDLLTEMKTAFAEDQPIVDRLTETMSTNGFCVSRVMSGSIVVKFRCSNSQSVHSLKQLHRDGTLDRMFTDTFCPKFADSGLQSLSLIVSTDEIQRCLKVFREMKLMTDEHREALLSSTKWLEDKMTVSSNLLDKLSLCKRRRQAIERASEGEKQVKMLLDIVSRQPDSAFTQLVTALVDTQQQDVADFIVNKTVDRKAKTTFKDLITDNFELLLRCLDPSPQLITKLLSLTVISDQLPPISQQATIQETAYALITALLEVPDELQESAMDVFVEALRSTGQSHVANIFCPESDKIPMSDDHYELLNKQRDQMCRFMDPENGLLDELVTLGVISSEDNKRIRKNSSLDAMAGELIDVILRKSDDAFDALIQALNDTGQAHVTFILTGQGTSVPLSQSLISVLVDCREDIVNTMEPVRSGLVPTLMSTNAFSQYDAQRLTDSCQESNEVILDLIMRKSESAIYSFFFSLIATDQHEAARILKAGYLQENRKVCCNNNDTLTN